MTNPSQETKWKQVYALALLSAAIGISWIAYHEYQPLILAKFGYSEFGRFLLIAKGVILVAIPPFAGWLSDLMSKRKGQPFLVFSYGIGSTAMVFMIVATMLSQASLGAVGQFLPIMIVLWLISMNVFTSPAISMIDSFAPKEKLPMVAAVLFFVVQLVFSLEPVIIQLITFFGDTLTFIVGGILIAGSGYYFQSVSKVTQTVNAKVAETINARASYHWPKIVSIGLLLGFGTAFLIEFMPAKAGQIIDETVIQGSTLSFVLLAFSALVALVIAKPIIRIGVVRVMAISLFQLVVCALLLWNSTSPFWFIFWGSATALAFSMASVSSLPYVLSHASRHTIAFTVGVYLGATHIMEGILENIL